MSENLRSPWGLRPQGYGLERRCGGVVLEGALATEGPLSEAKDLRGSVSDRRTSEALRPCGLRVTEKGVTLRGVSPEGSDEALRLLKIGERKEFFAEPQTFLTFFQVLCKLLLSLLLS